MESGIFRSPDVTEARHSTLADLALVVLGGFAFLVVVVLWFDNPQGGLTGNGIFKSLELKPWVVDPGHAKLFPSNYLFYPVYGALCRLLDGLGIYTGDPRHQLTILNAASASLCLGAVYLMARTLSGSRAVALLTALFHIACSYVLFLAIVNEDIMPSYAITFASMALAAVWFARPSAPRVIAVAVLFSLGWLFEWRLMFPTLPAMLAALWLCESRRARRFAWIAVFLVAILATAVVIAALWRGHDGAVGPLELIWTGKAVGSGWSGFSWAKLSNTRDGTVAYFLGTAITNAQFLPGWDIWRVVGLLMIAAIAAVSIPMLWRERRDTRTRAVAAVFGGTFVAGLVFNLYSQPLDPQMQINIMGWLTVGWMLAVMAAVRRWGRRGLVAALLLATALLVHNVLSLVPLRGLDTAWLRAIDRMGQVAAPAKSVFLIHDFDWTMNYAALDWGQSLPGTDRLGPAPQASPKFKWIGFADDIIYHPDATVEEHVARLKAQIDRALSRGYQVYIVRLWELDDAGLNAATGTMRQADHSAALGRMLHRDYDATLVLDDPLAGKLWRLEPKR